MWEMKTKVDKRLYDKGYYLTGEGNRVDVVDSEGNRYIEIFFLGKKILIKTEFGQEMADGIWDIFVSDDDGEPAIYYY